MIEGFNHIDCMRFTYDELSKMNKDQDYADTVFAAYGKDDIGKITLYKSVKLFDDIVLGRELADAIHEYMTGDKPCKIECSFTMEDDDVYRFITYMFVIGKNDEYDIVYEKMTLKEYIKNENKWLDEVVLFEFKDNDIFLHKELDELLSSYYTSYQLTRPVVSSIYKHYTYYRFNNCVFDNDEHSYTKTVKELDSFARVFSVFVENFFVFLEYNKKRIVYDRCK